MAARTIYREPTQRRVGKGQHEETQGRQRKTRRRQEEVNPVGQISGELYLADALAVGRNYCATVSLR